MTHTIEITESAFHALQHYAPCVGMEYKNGACFTYYYVHGCNLLTIEQPTSPKQYFIQDINA